MSELKPLSLPASFSCHDIHPPAPDANPSLSYWSGDNLVCKSCGMIIAGPDKGQKKESWISIFGTLTGKW